MQQLGDALVRQRVYLVLFVDQPLDDVLRRARRHVLAVVCGEAAGEEELQLEHAPRRLHVLAAAHAAHRGLVHVDLPRHRGQRERAQERDALVEELALFTHDAVHHLDHRSASLLDRLDQPPGRGQLALDVIARLLLLRGGVRLAPAGEDFAVCGRDAQPGHVAVVEHDHVLLVHALHEQVRHHVARILRRHQRARPRVQRGDAVCGRLHFEHAHLEQSRDLGEAAVHQVVEMVVDHAPGQRLLLAAGFQLQQQALAQVARADAGRLQGLHQPQHVLDLHQRPSDRFGDVLHRRREPAAIVDRADDELGDAHVRGRQVQEVQLLQQAFRERRARGRHLLQELDAGLGRRHVCAVEQSVLHVVRPVDRILLRRVLGLLVVLLVCGRLAVYVLLIGDLVHLFEQRVLQHLLLEDLLQLERRHLQQLERLLQPRRHDELLRLGQVQRMLHFHDIGP